MNPNNLDSVTSPLRPKMPPKTASKPAVELPSKRPAEVNLVSISYNTLLTLLQPAIIASDSPQSSVSPSSDESDKPLLNRKAAKQSTSTTNKRKATTKPSTAPASTDVKPSIETPTPAPKRPRLPTSTRPRPAQEHAIGATVFAKPFTSSDRVLKNTKVLATVESYEWDELTRGWAVNVTFAGPPMPVGACAFLPEKLLDGGFKVGELVSVKVNGGWCDGEVSGRTVEGDGKCFHSFSGV